MAKNPYTLTATERELAIDLFAQGKPLQIIKEAIAQSKGIAHITPEINIHLNNALRTVNPNNKLCTAKSRQLINDRKKQYLHDRRRAAFNSSSQILSAIEIYLETIVINDETDARQIKAIAEVIGITADMCGEYMDIDNDNPESRDAGDNQGNNADTKRTIEAIIQILRGSDGDAPDL